LSLFASTTATFLAAISVPQAEATGNAPLPIVSGTLDQQPVARAPEPTLPPADPVLPQTADAVAAAPQATPPDGTAAALTSTAPADPAQTGDEVVVRGRERGYAPDPIRALNARSFAATQAVDKAVVGPVARAYKKNVPSAFRRGVHNFLYNLREPVVFVNFILQHKIGKAVETVGRFAINSTAGVAGVLDVAKRRPFRLPRRGNGFADTLGFYGVSPGPFMFLPLVGPTTVRDLLGGAIDRLVLPVALGRRVTQPAFAVPAAVLGALDHRAEFDETQNVLHDGAADPYANTRDFYLQRRQAEIDGLRGRARRSSGPMSEPPTQPITLRGETLSPAAPPTLTPEPTR
jgi:phospholipid-binding lipoprotein MlaA